MSTPAIPYALHIWPPKWNLQSIDPACLAAVLYLQLTVPGKFQIIETVNPDLSQSGHLPFLTHGHVHVSTLPAIISFITSLSKSSHAASGVVDLDGFLNPKDKAKRTAWFAHIESIIGDLVSHMFYSLGVNYSGLIQPTLASMLPIPQRYYVPSRIRESYRPRLEASDLWSLPAIEQAQKTNSFGEKEKKEENPKDKFARVFEREKVISKARSYLDLYANLLKGKTFFFGDRISTLDVYFTAHILLLVDVPFPDPSIQNLIKESYPSLVHHARVVQSQVFPSDSAHPPTLSQSQSLLAMIPRPLSKAQKEKGEVDNIDVHFTRMRWTWITLAIGAVVYHLSRADFPIRISFGGESGKDEALEGDIEVDDEE